MSLPYGRATNELLRAQAFYAQALMHRAARDYRRARVCIEAARFHLAQCGALLGLNAWPK
jgi:hypothetical protein